MSTLQSALKLAAHGFRVFPCKLMDKQPHIPGWPEEATTDPDKIRAWWLTKGGEAMLNIGVLCDSVHVIDFDSKGDMTGEERCAAFEAEHGSLGETMRVLTPRGGIHVYHRTFEGARVSASKLGHGIDTRGGGKGYVVGPGSLLDRGQYRFAPGCSPDELVLFGAVATDGLPVAEAPDWLKEMVRRSGGSRQGMSAGPAPVGELDQPLDVRRAREWLERAEPAIEGQGGDNHTIVVANGVMDFVTEETALQLMLEIWNPRCQRPWDVDKLAEKVRNARKSRKDPVGKLSVGAEMFDVVKSSGLLGAVEYSAAALVDATDKVEQLLLTDAADPFLQQGACYVCVRDGTPTSVEELEGGGKYPPMPLVRRFDLAGLRERVMRSVVVQTFDGRSEKFKPNKPPLELIQTLLARRGGSAPPLTGIVEAPTLRRDGSLLAARGYDRATGLYGSFDPAAFDVPEHPTREQAVEGLRVLQEEMLAEFPFATDLDRDVAVAAFLTCLIRRTLDLAPLWLLSAPTQSTGKTALAMALCQAAYGRPAAAAGWPKGGEEELEKRVVAQLREGHSGVVWDNIPDGERVHASIFSNITTNTVYSGRVLGATEEARLPTNVTIMLTGNNLAMSTDLATRTVRCYLDARVERPDQRSYKRDLREWVAANRPRLVVAGLTILRYGRDAPAPKTATRFQEWDRRVRGPMLLLGANDPADAIDATAEADPTKDRLAAMLAAWESVFGETAVSSLEVFAQAENSTFEPHGAALRETLMDMFDGRSVKPSAKAVGQMLAGQVNRLVNGRRLNATRDAVTNTSRWQLSRVGTVG